MATARATQRDVAAHREVAEALRESEERFRTLAECLPHLVWPTSVPDVILTSALRRMHVSIRDESDVVVARTRAREFTVLEGLSSVTMKKWAR